MTGIQDRQREHGVMNRLGKPNNSVLALAVFLAGFVIFHFAGRTVIPALMYTESGQPVEFSHRIHGRDVGISCETCHFFYEDGSWSGIPTVEVCANCHAEVLGESEAERHFVTNYIKENKDVKWGLYFRQPQCVSFSHSSHVRGAKLACETCHGPQGLSGRSTKYLTNRITQYRYVLYDNEASSNPGPDAVSEKRGKKIWGTMGMDECAQCHRARGTSTACFICHK
ncbi:MAG: cytochrome c3 family protein [Candidatus Abyssubacteria bacterium]